MLVQRKISGAKFNPKTYKKTKIFIKKNVFSDFFSYKNLTYWFLRAYCEISAQTDVSNLFFPS